MFCHMIKIISVLHITRKLNPATIRPGIAFLDIMLPEGKCWGRSQVKSFYRTLLMQPFRFKLIKVTLLALKTTSTQNTAVRTISNTVSVHVSAIKSTRG
jgi:hypothetical protein